MSYIRIQEPPKKCCKCPQYEPVFRENTYCGFNCSAIPNGIRCTMDGNVGRVKQCPLITGRSISPDGPRPKKEDIMGDGHTVYRRSNKFKNKEKGKFRYGQEKTSSKERTFNPRNS